MAKSRLVTQYEKFQEPGHRVGHPKERALYEQAKRYIVKNYDSLRSGYLEHIKEQRGIKMQDQEPTREELIEHFAKKAVVKREYTTTPMTNSELIENLAHTREFLPKKKQMVEASREGLKKFGYSKNSTKFLRYDERVGKLGNITLANGTTGELTGEYISTNKKNNTEITVDNVRFDRTRIADIFISKAQNGDEILTFNKTERQLNGIETNKGVTTAKIIQDETLINIESAMEHGNEYVPVYRNTENIEARGENILSKDSLYAVITSGIDYYDEVKNNENDSKEQYKNKFVNAVTEYTQQQEKIEEYEK